MPTAHISLYLKCTFQQTDIIDCRGPPITSTKETHKSTILQYPQEISNDIKEYHNIDINSSGQWSNSTSPWNPTKQKQPKIEQTKENKSNFK